MNDSISGDAWNPDVLLPAVDHDAGYVSDASSQYEVDDSLIAHYTEPAEPTGNCANEVPLVDVQELGISQPESIYEVDESLILGYAGTPPPATQVSNSNSTDVSSRNSSSTSVLSNNSSLGKRKMCPVPEMDQCATKIAKFQTDTTADENVYIIAHDPQLEGLFSQKGIGHAFLYELARMVSNGLSYESITDEKLQNLLALERVTSSKFEAIFTTREVVPQDDHVASMFASEIAAMSPWEDILQEEQALAKDPEGGVGNNTDWPNWYAGKGVYRARLVEAPAPETGYRLRPEPLTSGPSSRFTRRFGSCSFLRVKVSDKILHSENNGLESFFKKRFVLWNKVYRAVYAKDGTVFLLWTNEKYLSEEKVPDRLSFEGFFNWSNPLSDNGHQLMTKWAARTALGFSNSVPGPFIAQKNVHIEKDIMSANGKSDMTDGCGFTSKNIHIMLANQFSLPKPPSAFQFRYAGFKGMSVIKEDDKNDNIARGYFRPSQTKIAYPLDRVLDRSQQTMDILRTSSLKTSTRLSAEVIINLHENGVPPNVFVKLMEQSVNALVAALTTWDGPDDMFNLWMNVERAEGVMLERKARFAKGEARVRGARNTSIDDHDEDENQDEKEDSNDPELELLIDSKSAPWWPDNVSGCPATLGETVMSFLDSGFKPQSSPVLRDKLKNILDKAVTRETTKLRFEVRQSCTAFAIADPYNVLGENEIHVKSSRHEFKLDDETVTDTIIGEVLVTRNPCKVPSDTRKVRAVDHPALRHYTDVVVFSTKGNRRLIDYLAGGDYDGDTVIVFWDKSIVEPFKNADDKYSHEPPIVESCFTRDMEMGKRFLERLKDLPNENDRIQAYQASLLGALRSTFHVGKYSTWHDNAIYKLGYTHPETQELAAKFCRVLDSAKTGYRIKPEIYREDKRKYDHPLGPKWKTITKGKKKQEHNLIHLARNQNIRHAFIIDTLIDAAHNLWNNVKKDMKTKFSHDETQEDPDLAAPWLEAEEWAEKGDDPAFVKQKKQNLTAIALHVREVFLEHKSMFRHGRFNKIPLRLQQDNLRKISQKFASSPKPQDVPHILGEATLRRLRASYAYIYDGQQKGMNDDGLGFSRFPFNVAMRELCAIKASALGPTKVVAGQFYDRFRLRV